MLDGRFSPDGTSFVVSDVAGQFSLYALGPPTLLLLSAPYDQFFLHEYHAEAFALDSAGFAMLVNPETRVILAPWWQVARQFAVLGGALVLLPLADNLFTPYPETFQAAYRAGRVLEYVKAGMVECLGNACTVCVQQQLLGTSFLMANEDMRTTQLR